MGACEAWGNARYGDMRGMGAWMGVACETRLPEPHGVTQEREHVVRAMHLALVTPPPPSLPCPCWPVSVCVGTNCHMAIAWPWDALILLEGEASGAIFPWWYYNFAVRLNIIHGEYI